MATALISSHGASDRPEHTSVHIALREPEQRETHALLFQGKIGPAITFDYEHAPGRYPPGSGKSTEHLMDDPIMVVLPVGHPLAGADSVAPADLPSDAWINTTVDVRGLAASAVDRDRGNGHRLDFDPTDFRTALGLIAAGLGVALLPRLLPDAPPGVVALPMRQPTVVRSLYTCRLDTRGVAASDRRLERCLRETVAEL